MKYLAMGARLKKLREKQGLSIDELAGRVGLESSVIKSFEEEKETPRIAQLIRFAKSLNVNVADIFRDRPVKKDFEVLRKHERQKHSPLLNPHSPSKIKEYTYEMLTLPSDDKHIDAYLIEVPSHQLKKSFEHLSHPGEEFVFMLEGKLIGSIADEEISLEQGDSLYLRSSIKHSFYNPFDQLAKAISIIYPF